jgi:hypothetical protein
MLTTGCKLGVLFSFAGVSGNGWRDASGLIKKFYLHKEDVSSRYCLIDFNIADFRAIANGNNFLQIIDDKLENLQFDTDYTSNLSPHPAEAEIK